MYSLFSEKRNQTKEHETTTKLSWKCGPAREIQLRGFYLSVLLGECRALRCKLPCPKWHLVAKAASSHCLGLGAAAAAAEHIPHLHQWLRDTEQNPSLGQYRRWYWCTLVCSPASPDVDSSILHCSNSSHYFPAWMVWIHALKQKPIRTVFFSCVNLPDKQIEIPRFIQPHL